MLAYKKTIVAVAVLMVASTAMAQQPRGRGRGGFGFGGPGRGGPGRGEGSAVMLLQMPEVRREIGTTEEQNQRIDTLLAETREQMRGNFNFRDLQDLSEEERRERMEELRKKSEEVSAQADAKLAELLDAKQFERLKQLNLQRQGLAALSRPEVAKELDLSEEQQEKIKTLQEEARSLGRPQGNFREMSEEERREAFSKMQQQREKAEADTLAVLTEAQKTKWTEMQGQAFEFPRPQFGAGGGDRGFGGPRGNVERKRPPRKKE